MFLGTLTAPLESPNVGLAISLSNPVEPKHRVSHTKKCSFQALKNSVWKRRPIRSVNLRFLMILMSSFEKVGPRKPLIRGPSPKSKLNELGLWKAASLKSGPLAGLKLVGFCSNGLTPGISCGMQPASNCDGRLQVLDRKK